MGKEDQESLRPPELFPASRLEPTERGRTSHDAGTIQQTTSDEESGTNSPSIFEDSGSDEEKDEKLVGSCTVRAQISTNTALGYLGWTGRFCKSKELVPPEEMGSMSTSTLYPKAEHLARQQSSCLVLPLYPLYHLQCPLLPSTVSAKISTFQTAYNYNSFCPYSSLPFHLDLLFYHHVLKSGDAFG